MQRIHVQPSNSTRDCPFNEIKFFGDASRPTSRRASRYGTPSVPYALFFARAYALRAYVARRRTAPLLGVKFPAAQNAILFSIPRIL